MSLNILLIQGSLHQQSATAAMIQFVKEEIQKLGAEVNLLDLRKFEIPHYNPDTAKETDAYKKLKPLVDEADAYILGTPDYHGTPSGPLKNFLDYFWHEFSGKLFGYVCASHEKGLLPMETLRTAVRQCYGWSLPYGVSGLDEQEINSEGKITGEKLKNRLTMLAHDSVTYGKILKEQRQKDLARKEPGFLASLRIAN
ncbi:MAG: NAD(P)H-dependent oxidoreductase [bacterium]|nr:NAD(P)H-dependent oxidoreductase [bacterium]